MGFPVRFDNQRMSDSEDSEELDKETIGKRVSIKHNTGKQVKNFYIFSLNWEMIINLLEITNSYEHLHKKLNTGGRDFGSGEAARV